MRTLLSVLLSTVTGLALISAAAPARAQTVYPRCAVVTTNGGGTLDPGRTGIGFGTGTLTMEAEYADATNAVPTFFDYEYTNNARYQRGATSANYETMMTVNGAPQNVSPHLNY